MESDSDGGCEDAHTCKVAFLHNRARDVLTALKKVKKKDRDDLEAMADIVDAGAKYFQDYDELIPALSSVFLGLEESNFLTVWNAQFVDTCAAVRRPECAANQESGLYFLDEGFHNDFSDKQSQPFHFWAYLATSANTQDKLPVSYVRGAGVSLVGNAFHEFVPENPDGATWQDYALGVAGSNIGTMVNMGVISPNQLGNAIREQVGIGGPGAPYIDPLKKYVPLQGNR